ncbi:hypothetical protein BVRB_9g204240 [Beta vulgaris subsp. vulgaris]|nr:hypothetical protein BVRB_9g204240 [Beta vulgaris subsp. vulgaris]
MSLSLRHKQNQFDQSMVSPSRDKALPGLDKLSGCFSSLLKI